MPTIPADTGTSSGLNMGIHESMHQEAHFQDEPAWPWESECSDRYPDKDPAKLTEFERRYPPDQVGNELCGNARVFRIYQDRMNELDGDTIAGWNDTLNFLLVFAGLFSAVMTAFLIEFAKRLEPDYSEYASMTLLVVAARMSGQNETLVSDSGMDPRKFRPKASHRAINALWFISLTLSLLVSMLAILSKQWIGMFSSRMRMPVRDLRRWSHRHRAYRNGVDRWHLDEFISSLSVLLHLALFLFLFGLIIRTYELDLVIFVSVTSLSALTLLFYALTTLAPLFDGTCPTATPLLVHGRMVVLWPSRWLSRWQVASTDQGIFTQVLRWLASHSTNRPPAFAEEAVLEGNASAADIGVVVWIVNHLPGKHDVNVALDAVAQLPREERPNHLIAAEQTLNLSIVRLRNLTEMRHPGEILRDAAELARVLRSAIHLTVEKGNQFGEVPRSLLHDIPTHDVSILARVYLMRLALYDPIQQCWPPPAVRFNVRQLCSALGSWIRSTDSHRSVPVSEHTRRILYDVLAEAAERTPSFNVVKPDQNLITIEDCAWLVLTFCREQVDAPAWIELMIRFLDHAIRSSPLSNSWIPLPATVIPCRRAIHAWAWVFMCISSEPDPLVFGSLQAVHVARCFLLLIECSTEIPADAVTMSLLQLQHTLAPFNYDITDTATAISGVFRLLQHATNRWDVAQREWNSSIGQVIFNIFDRSTCHRRHLMSSNAVAFLTSLQPPPRANAHQELAEGLCQHGTAPIMVERSMINILTPRTARDGSRTSTWRLAFAHMASTDHVGALSGLALGLSIQLSLVAALDPTFQVAELYQELFGDGRGTRILLAAGANDSSALFIARHIYMTEPSLWTDIRGQLMVSDLAQYTTPRMSYLDSCLSTAPSRTALNMIVEGDGERPCTECARAVKLVQQFSP